MSEAMKEYQNTILKTSRLTRSEKDYLMSQLGTYDKMDVYQSRQMADKKLKGSPLSDEIIHMREEGW